MADEQTEREDGGGVATANETLSVTDNRTGESYDVEISDGTVKAMDFRQIKVSEDDFGLMTYDPAFTNTASVRSSVCFIDGEAGILEYRGYPIDQLCEKSSYLEVAYLLIYGELPTQEQLDEWIFEITHHTFVHENIKKFVEGFRYDAHPMGMLLATVGRALDLLSGREEDRRRARAPHGRGPADREDADARRLRVPAQPRAALRLSGQRPVLPRQLPLDDVQDDRGASTSPTRGSSAPSTSSGSCTPTTSRTARRTRCAGSARQRWTRTRLWPPAWPRSTARCTAAPTRRC